MSKKISKANFRLKMSLLGFSLSLAVVIGGCAVSAKNLDEAPAKPAVGEKNNYPQAEAVTKNSHLKGRIEITANSPADAIRTFYKNLREKRFREAMMMTNLRPAVEGLSDSDMQDLNADFEPLAKQVPADIQISGEIVSGNSASVTAKMPNEDTGAIEDKVFNLRRENDSWIILTADEKAEADARKEGKNYFFSLRIEVHETEAQMMLERIVKAQVVYSLQNGGTFADMQTLVAQGLLAEDAQTVDSTGYRYNIMISPDKKKYFATAEPAVYRKTGKLSFLVEVEGADKKSNFKSKDNGGMPLRK